MKILSNLAFPLLPSLLAGSLGLSTLSAQVPEVETSAQAEVEVTEAIEEAAPAVEPAPIALVRLDGVYADLAEAGGDLTTLLLSGGGGKPPKPFYEMLEQIEGLADSESEVVLFDLTRPFGLQGPHLAELERAMQKVKKAGKRCYAYIENAGSGTYQIAALCDEVLMADLGSLDLPSAAMSVMFMKDALDLLGVQFDVVRCGDFKGAVEPYVLSSMSKHLRSHYEAMLEAINNDTAHRIAAARGLGHSQVRNAQAKRMFSAREAKDAGLVDRIVAWRGAEHAIEQALGREDVELSNVLSEKRKRRGGNPMSFLSELFRPKKETEVEEVSLVVLHLSGQIIDGHKAAPGSIVSGPTVTQIEKLTKNENVKGVVVRVNSPGGSATASEAILLALQDLAKVKPVVVSMGSLAASGGYYVTCLGRPILAEATTITGSIGVFGMRPVLGPLMRRIGIHNELIALDDSASMTSMDIGWTDEQKEVVQAHVNQIYDVFIGHVARSRAMPSGEVLKIAGGRVWSGEQAVENGLVDRIGGLGDALAMVAKEAGAAPDEYEVSHVPQPKSFMDAIAEEFLNVRAVLPFASTEHLIASKAGLGQALRVLFDAITNPQPTRVWAMMPDVMTLR